MAFEIKTSDNTSIAEINTIKNPNTKTLIDRYVWASNWCKGKSVADIASGYGYGGVILRALGAKEVDCYDIDQNALNYIADTYDGFVDYGYLDATKEQTELDNQYDVIVSIETFEHVPRESVPTMLSNFKRMCKKGGKIIITTPHRRAEKFIYKGGTHLYEYSLPEFQQEISKIFSVFDIWFGVEFTSKSSNELNTSFTKNTQFMQNANIIIAVIKNE